MIRSNQIDIVRTLLLQIQKCLCQLLYGNLPACFSRTDLPVLKIATTQSTARKEYSTRAFLPGNTGLLPKVECCSGNSDPVICTADTPLTGCPVHPALPRAEMTALIHYSRIIFTFGHPSNAPSSITVSWGSMTSSSFSQP